MTRTRVPRLPAALATLLLATLPAAAIDGGSLAGCNRLSQATVGISTLVAGDEDTAGVSRCSGVLIGPRLVLTAGHCVRGDPLAAAVVLDDGARALRPAIPVRSVARDATGEDEGPAQDRSLASLSLETAVLRLAAAVRGRAPLRIIRSGRVLQTLRLAGAGLSADGVGVLETTPLLPLAVTRSGVLIAASPGSAVRKGDLGGPVRQDEPDASPHADGHAVLPGTLPRLAAPIPPCSTHGDRQRL